MIVNNQVLRGIAPSAMDPEENQSTVTSLIVMHKPVVTVENQQYATTNTDLPCKTCRRNLEVLVRIVVEAASYRLRPFDGPPTSTSTTTIPKEV